MFFRHQPSGFLFSRLVASRRPLRTIHLPVQNFDTIVAAIEAEGLAGRGAFHVVAEDSVRRSGTARPPRRWFSSATRGPECGPPSPHRKKRRMARRTLWTDGAGGWSRASRMLSAEPRTSRSAALPGCRSSGGHGGPVPSIPRPSGRWRTRTTACGTRTGARWRFASPSSFRPGTIARAPARAAPDVPACRPVPSVRSPRRATTSKGAPPTSRAAPARAASARDASPGTHARPDAVRRTAHPRRRSTCTPSSTRDGARGKAPERSVSIMRPVRDGAIVTLSSTRGGVG